MISCFYCVFQMKANTPVLMCSVPGYDASSRVDDLMFLLCISDEG